MGVTGEHTGKLHFVPYTLLLLRLGICLGGAEGGKRLGGTSGDDGFNKGLPSHPLIPIQELQLLVCVVWGE